MSTSRLPELTRKIPQLAGAKILRRLTCGPISDKWLLATDMGRWVLRVDRPLARDLGLARDNERLVLQALADLGWVSAPLWADTASGVLVTAYQPGKSWSQAQYHHRGQLRRLAQMLARLHSLPIKEPTFDLASRVQGYANIIGTSSALQRCKHVVALLEEISAVQDTSCFCHNDAVGGNVLEANGLCLIDWEYAAVGHPLFDLAAVIEYHDLSDRDQSAFVAAYVESGMALHPLALRGCREVYRLVCGLWSAALTRLGSG